MLSHKGFEGIRIQFQISITFRLLEMIATASITITETSTPKTPMYIRSTIDIPSKGEKGRVPSRVSIIVSDEVRPVLS